MDSLCKGDTFSADTPRCSDARRRHANGFTLIELIVVIVVLAVLGAIALPRFIDLGREARVAKLEAARGAVGSAAALAHSASIARGLPPGDPIMMAGAPVTMTMSYPSATLTGIVVASGLDAADYVFETGNGSDPPNTLRVKVPGGPDVNSCFFTYTAPFVPGEFPAISAPTVGSSAGC